MTRGAMLFGGKRATLSLAPTLSVSRGNQQFSYTITAPTDTGGAPILNYLLQWKSGAQSYNSTRQRTVATSALTGTVTGLANGTAYTVRAIPVTRVGNGTASAERTVTPATTPGTPGLTLTAGALKLGYTITAPSSNGGNAITTYRLRWKSGAQSYNSTRSTTITVGSDSLTGEITGLTAGTAYTVEVTAVNGVGRGGARERTATPTAQATVPSRGAAPAAAAGNKRMTWTATPPSDGGSAITAYDWRWRTNGSGSWTEVDDDDATLTVTGLSNGTQYEAQFKAKNTVGAAASWSPSGRATTWDVPGKASLSLAARPPDTIRATITAPSSDSTILRHRIQWKSGAQSYNSTRETTSTSASVDIGSLSQGTEYTMRVRSESAVGDGGWSDDATAILASVPGRGTAPSATGSANQVRWTATAPNNGGSAITHYLWRWREVGDVSWRTTVTTTARTFARTGLTANTRYEAQFKARNAIGDAASWSPSGTATATRPALGVPGSRSSTVKPRQFVASWGAVSGATTYDFRWSTSSDMSNPTTVTNAGRSETVTGLTPNTPYYWEVRAKDTSRTGAWSPTETATTQEDDLGIASIQRGRRASIEPLSANTNADITISAVDTSKAMLNVITGPVPSTIAAVFLQGPTTIRIENISAVNTANIQRISWEVIEFE